MSDPQPLDYYPKPPEKPKQPLGRRVMQFIAGCVALISFVLALVWGSLAFINSDGKAAVFALLFWLLAVACFFIPWLKM